MSGPRLVIAHDDCLVREIVSSAVVDYFIEVVGIAATYEDVVRECEARTPDVVLVADRLGSARVEDVLELLVKTPVRVIILSSDASPDRPGHLLLHNVDGYLSYDASPDDLASGIVAAARGEAVVAPEALVVILQQWRRFRSQPIVLSTRRKPTLTPRELDILTAMTDGLGAKAIAAHLGVAVKTVENHKIHIFEKLGVKSHAHAVTVALSYGLARAPDVCP